MTAIKNCTLIYPAGILSPIRIHGDSPRILMHVRVMSAREKKQKNTLRCFLQEPQLTAGVHNIECQHSGKSGRVKVSRLSRPAADDVFASLRGGGLPPPRCVVSQQAVYFR